MIKKLLSRKILGNDSAIIGEIALIALVIFLVVVIGLVIAFFVLGPLTIISIFIIGVGLFILAFHKGPLKVGIILLLLGIILFFISYLGVL